MDYEGPTGGLPAASPEKVGIREILADRAIRLVIVVVFVVLLGFGIVFPILPLYAQSFGVGPDAAGPLVAALGLASPLFFYAGILFVAGGLYLWLVPDPGAGVNRTESSDEPGPGIGALLRRREFQAAIVLNFAYLWIIGAAYDTLLPLFGNNVLGMTTQAIGVVVGIALAGELVVLYPTGWLMDRSGRRGVAVWSMLAMAVM